MEEYSDSIVENELENFRENWKNEVCERQLKSNASIDHATNGEKQTIQKAIQLFKEGIEHERKGKFPEAVKCYSLAVHLDPEIEQRLTEMLDFHPNTDSQEAVPGNNTEEIDLLKQFGALTFNNHDSDVLITSFNITQLPDELLTLIFRWVASDDLDLASVEVLSQVCRKFYLISKEQSLWQAACYRVWGAYANKSLYKSWRQMYIERPRVLLNGVYISKVNYFREGDRTNNTPFQCVEYYRYMRFFSNGQMLMYTSAEEPPMVISKLTLEDAQGNGFRVGKYKLFTSNHEKSSVAKITAILKEKKEALPRTSSGSGKRRRPCHDFQFVATEIEYLLDLEVTSTQKKKFNKLTWKKYTCRCIFGDGVRQSSDEHNLRDQFPPLYFSLVKSYNTVSYAPL